MDLTHAAQRKALGAFVDHVIKIKDHEDRRKTMLHVTYIIQTLFGSMFKDSTFDTVRHLLKTNKKWWEYLNHGLDTLNPNVIKTTVMNLGYEASFYGNKIRNEKKEQYNMNIPWAILFDPTTACNCHCIGCWAADYGHQKNLSMDVMRKIIRQGKELGIYFYMMTGGEPTTRIKDILTLCRENPDCEFHAFTNGTLITDEICKEICKVGNLSFSISVEGFEEANDSRRGRGCFDKAMHAMDLLRKYGIIFGTSICYTRKNIADVTSDKFIDMLISKGALFTWYFHYMPVGKGAALDLLPTPEQRAYMIHRVREIRGIEGGKPFFAIDFQNDGQYIGGCVAGGRNYCHINANGDVEPCVFIHYSNANINDMDLIDCLRQPLFQAYREGQPFNNNHLRPCPMLENPPDLVKLVNDTGAKSTDYIAPESAEELCRKTLPYARRWAPMAAKCWADIKAQKEKEAQERKGSAGKS